ncbi:MAG TPA: phosphoribosylanthranilate isomerase [Rectinemataceae bacterium]|nr:phosphoribosylanthranilate isomerase [Rectinemataceae bacterium]
MTKVKICGITRLGDARLALFLGASEIGFILAPSPRRVEAALVRDIVASLRDDGALATRREALGLPPFRAIGVFVNESPNVMRDTLRAAGLDAAQIHGDEDPHECALFDFPWYRAVRPSTPEEARRLAEADWACPRILADAALRGVYGGSGSVLASGVAAAARDAARGAGREFFLAGGLGPSKAAQAIMEIGPDGIDLSSGVEEAPGRKSASLLEALFEEVWRADRELGKGKEADHAAR